MPPPSKMSTIAAQYALCYVHRLFKLQGPAPRARNTLARAISIDARSSGLSQLLSSSGTKLDAGVESSEMPRACVRRGVLIVIGCVDVDDDDMVVVVVVDEVEVRSNPLRRGEAEFSDAGYEGGGGATLRGRFAGERLIELEREIEGR